MSTVADIALILAFIQRIASSLTRLGQIFKDGVTVEELDALDAEFAEAVSKARATIAAKRAEIASRTP